MFCCLGGGAGPAKQQKKKTRPNSKTPPPPPRPFRACCLFVCLFVFLLFGPVGVFIVFGGWSFFVVCFSFFSVWAVCIFFFFPFGRGACLFVAVWAGACCFFLFRRGGGVFIVLLFGRGTGVHSLTGLPGSSSSHPTTKKTKQPTKMRVPYNPSVRFSCHSFVICLSIARVISLYPKSKVRETLISISLTNSMMVFRRGTRFLETPLNTLNPHKP